MKVICLLCDEILEDSNEFTTCSCNSTFLHGDRFGGLQPDYVVSFDTLPKVIVRNLKTYNKNACNKKAKTEGVYIGRPSMLGNPSRKMRTQAITDYNNYFHKRLHTDKNFQNYVDNLGHKAQQRPIVLLCWCWPLACHGSIIQQYIESNY